MSFESGEFFIKSEGCDDCPSRVKCQVLFKVFSEFAKASLGRENGLIVARDRLVNSGVNSSPIHLEDGVLSVRFSDPTLECTGSVDIAQEI